MLPQAESPSGRYRRSLFQKQRVKEKPGSALVCGSMGVGIVVEAGRAALKNLEALHLCHRRS